MLLGLRSSAAMWPILFTLAACNGPVAMIAVANSSGNSVTEYPVTATGNVTPAAVLAGSATRLWGPSGVAIDSVGSLRVANESNNTITTYVSGASGNASPLSTIQSTSTVGGPFFAVAVDGAGNDYVAEQPNTGEGVFVYARGANGNDMPVAVITANGTLAPDGVAVDGSGRIYVSNSALASTLPAVNSVAVFAPGANGNASPIALIQGSQTMLQVIAGIAVQPDGTLYVAQLPGAVLVFAPGSNGNVAPIRVISGPNTGLYLPYGVAVDANGRVYVTNSCRIGCSPPAPPDSVVVLESGANGNATPVSVISGSQTGLNLPIGVAIVPARAQ